MPVDTRKSDYREAEAGWQRCRDCFAGSDAVKRRGTAYLPQVEGMVADRVNGGTAYVGYLARALFYPAMQRTVSGLAGLVFAKPPTASGIPQTFQPVFDDVTLSGVSLLAFGLDLCQEILTVGRVGLLLDLPEAVVANAAPYWVKYQAEQILSWQSERVNGRHILTQVVLSEFAEEANPNDEWDILRIEQFRVLQLRDGIYQVERYRRDPNDRTKFVQLGERAVPLRRGQPLKFIPFTIFGPSNIAPQVETPPLLALADVNLSHFRTSADHEHGAHFTALPTPWVSGHTLPANETLAIGSGTAWVFPQENARVGMLEFTGAGLSALANLKEEKRLMMVSLGARMLETQRNVQEAAQTVRLRHAGERSAMSVLADTEGQGLTQVVRWHLWWSGIEDAAALQAKISLNPDSMDELSADDIRALVASWQAGAISHKTLLYNLQWGEWLPPGVSAEEEIALIAREPGSLPLPEVA